ncbi:MAG: DUF2254 domain-containing protein [Oleiphilus sp.]|nr:MAG: DUF2254 domain-containing protein [Oleiphilus sp.]
MQDKLRFIINRWAERLWVKPLLVCILSVIVAFLAQLVDELAVFRNVPKVNPESITMLLKVISSSMLVMAVFAVGSMLAAYQSASKSGTPRSFALVVSDDVSQNALSTFIGAFIFSIVAQVAMLNGYYENAGKFFLFLITIFVFVLVIFSFIKWVDSIARLGLLGTVIEKVEHATCEALMRRRDMPFLGGVASENSMEGEPICPEEVGYIQRIDMLKLQTIAENAALRIELAVLPGVFVTPDQPLAYVTAEDQSRAEMALETKSLVDAFEIGRDRTFDDDPQFGLIALSEIASRALSPAVNDPGTAIEITDIFVRVFVRFSDQGQSQPKIDFDRVAVPALATDELLQNAFSAISRDGAGSIEVVVRTLKALSTLTRLGHETVATSARKAAYLTVAHAEKGLQLPSELEQLKEASTFLQSSPSG